MHGTQLTQERRDGGTNLAASTESGWHFAKDLVTSTHGMVAAKHPLAARAGLNILRQGGNAVDAAVGTAFVVGVVEPWASGLGGGGVLLVSSPNMAPVAIDYGVRAPAAARPDMFKLHQGYDQETSWWPSVRDDANIHGALAVAVPGAPAGLAAALAEFGTMPLADVLRPAIVLARDGFPIHWTTVLQISMDALTLRRYPSAADVFLPGGAPPPISTITAPQLLRQPELARTLELIASEGADAFYRGPVAGRIVEAVQRGGGILTLDDLAQYHPVREPAHRCHRSGYCLAVAPGPHAGITLAEIFEIIAALPERPCGHNTADYLHFLIEATHAALTDRFTLLGEGIGWGRLAGGGRLEVHRGRIVRGRAAPWSVRGPDPTSTTHLCVIDSAGTAVSLTQTLLSWFGSRVAAPGTGVVLNNGMMWFNPVPGQPNSVGPGRRPLSNMTPALVSSQEQPVFAVGASGGRRIVNAVLQVVLNAMDFAMDAQSAIAAPRIDASDAQVVVDVRIPEEIHTALRRRGHEIVAGEEQVWPRSFASPVAIARDSNTGVLCGGADPFHPAIAAGY
jgi:gamma-glutamyltranspeptidase / glutathione hydrolase